jgi:protoporphyrinogen IX oxidase
VEGYLWLRALHIISIIAWMAGLLYLPRLYVYHCRQAPGTPASDTFKVMERRLLRFITTPAMLASYLFGIWLIWMLGAGAWSAGWLHAKILLVLLLTALHGMMAKWRRDFQTDRNRHSERFYRVMNEIPTLLMVGIVILAVVKPF